MFALIHRHQPRRPDASRECLGALEPGNAAAFARARAWGHEGLRGGPLWRHRSRERGTGRRWCVLGAWAKQPCAAHAAAARCQIAGSSRDSWYRPWRSISGSAKLVAVRVPVLGEAPASVGCAGSETEGRHQFCLLFHRRRSSAGAEFRGVDQRLRANGALRRVRGDVNFPGRRLARGRTHLAATFRHHGLVRFKTSRRRVSWSEALSARVEEKKTTYA